MRAGTNDILTLKRVPKRGAIEEPLLHVRAALKQAEGHCQVYAKRGIEHWDNAIRPLFLFARDNLGMRATASFGRGHNPPRSSPSRVGQISGRQEEILSHPKYTIAEISLRLPAASYDEVARTTVLQSCHILGSSYRSRR